MAARLRDRAGQVRRVPRARACRRRRE